MTRLFTCLILLASSGVASGDELHLIVLDRERAVGDQSRVQVSGKESQDMTQFFIGQKANEQSTQISTKLTGIVEVLELHPDKNTKSIAIKLESIEIKINGEPVPLKTDRRLIVKMNASQPVFAYEGGEAITDTRLIKALDLATSQLVEKDDDNASEQQLFNLDMPRAVGNYWDCNKKLLAQQIKKDAELLVDEKNIEARAGLPAIKEHDGERCAQLNVSVKMTDVTIPAAVAQGMTTDRSYMNMFVTSLVPLDPKATVGTMKMDMSMGFTMSMQTPQGGVTMAMTAKREVESSRTKID